ncbi:MAG: hypothetical protein QOJ96_4031 [Alphaproteobacteria bacterium]|nr:hypothetical protein [Alphaproteobacteria bacterium]
MQNQRGPGNRGVRPARSRRRDLILSLATSVVSLVLFLALIEIVLRFLPVTSAFGSVPVTSESPIFHFAPNRPYVTSLGWDLHSINRGRVNNVGFVNDQDYRRDDPLPLVAVIGDSFIEARLVPYAQTLQGHLAETLAGKFRVYSFAASGAPLSQYLIWARHAVREYGAKAVVINVVGNDYDESHAAYKVGPGFWLYAPDAAGKLTLRLTDYHPGWLIELGRSSALVRYVVVNLRLHEAIFHIKALGELIFGGPAHAQPRYAGNTEASIDAKRVSDSLAAIDAFFRDLPEVVGLSPENVLFTVDGFRYPESQRGGRGTYFDVMRSSFLEKARALGYEAIDLDPLFIARNRETGEAFELPDDNHWNSNGHRVAAEAAASSRLLTRLRQ